MVCIDMRQELSGKNRFPLSRLCLDEDSLSLPGRKLRQILDYSFSNQVIFWISNSLDSPVKSNNFKALSFEHILAYGLLLKYIFQALPFSEKLLFNN